MKAEIEFFDILGKIWPELFWRSRKHRRCRPTYHFWRKKYPNYHELFYRVLDAVADLDESIFRMEIRLVSLRENFLDNSEPFSRPHYFEVIITDMYNLVGRAFPINCISTPDDHKFIKIKEIFLNILNVAVECRTCTDISREETVANLNRIFTNYFRRTLG